MFERKKEGQIKGLKGKEQHTKIMKNVKILLYQPKM